MSEKCTEGRGTHEVLFWYRALAIRNLQISRCLRDTAAAHRSAVVG